MLNLYIEKNGDLWFGIITDEEKIYATTFNQDRKTVLRNLLLKVPFNMPFKQNEKSSAFARRILKSLKNIYYGKETSESFPLATEQLSVYSRKVIEAVLQVPIGYVTSYVFVAKCVGGSPRAVGRVMASNLFPLLVPCHRVVRSDFTLGGYGFGLNVKLEILKRESRGFSSEREIRVNDGKLRVFPVEFVLKRVNINSFKFNSFVR
ncbi:MGMT family protein [Candidatus Bathyarchaeota archaeon]|nr:MGMT family protein [Candidatus Bathyarchaeota archaeon]